MTALSAQIQNLLTTSVQLLAGAAGLVFGAIQRDARVLVAEAAGKSSLDKPDPVTLDTVFAIYSMSKLITAIAAMELVEQGKVRLDDPIEKVAPEFAHIRIRAEDGTERASKKKVTLRMLLTHTSGFAYTLNNEIIFNLAKEREHDEFNGTKQGLLDMPVIQEPDTEFNYGTSIDWVGEIVSRLSGLTLDEFCRQNIFGPLGINGTGWTLSPEGRRKLAGLHERLADGSLGVREHMSMITLAHPYQSGGGGAFSDLHSFLTLAAMLLRDGVGTNGVRVLGHETVDEMFRDQIEHLPGTLDRPAANLRPDLVSENVPAAPVPKGYGLSFMIFKDELPTGRSAGTAWWAGLTNGQWTIDRTKGVAMVMLCSSLPLYDPAAFNPFLSAETAVYASLASS
ncbi:beta-lactamase/transpeptidase-like protein [Auricularia subglabra TFB-10046 SS5]|nr:beta-lactamase/transpeptidase-like protein [Auricularia subglabra TFB-10046 SS5]